MSTFVQPLILIFTILNKVISTYIRIDTLMMETYLINYHNWILANAIVIKLYTKLKTRNENYTLLLLHCIARIELFH